jgi:superfamily I DNA/RNA helicase
MQNLRSPLKLPHDGYLKLWALSKPRLPYDIILLDEAQDTNPLTLELVMAQRHAALVLVGDKHQGIYGFRKAMNAMERVQADERVAITQSFRFGQGIADVATALLKHFKDEPLAVKGRTDIEVAWTLDRDRHHAILGRTNAGIFTAAAELVVDAGSGNRRLHFIGGFDSYPFGKVLDAYYLWADERARIKDASISRFQSFEDFRAYGAEAGDAEVKALVKTVELYRTQVPKVYNAIRAADTPAQDRADVTLTTAHKAKGLEWEQVEVLPDFFDPMDPPPEADLDPEEVNLLYVAVTRAIRAVQLPPSLTAWLRKQGGHIEPVALPQTEPQTSHEAPRLFSNDDERESWLRANLDRFGDAAEEMSFLLQRLDAARSLHR